MTRAARIAALALALLGVPASECPAAQAQPDSGGVRVDPYLTNLTRIEGWSFFDPLPAGALGSRGEPGDPDYFFPANRATLGVALTSERFDVDGAFQYTQLGNLPLDAFGPGALGGGALYAFHAQSDLAFQLYLKRLTLTWKLPSRGVGLTVGRMAYRSGLEADSGVPAIEAVKALRLGERLIGPFEWSLFERAFDGARVDYRRRGWRVTGAAFMPTQGTYEESATPTMERVRVATASVGRVPQNPVGVPTEWQAFANVYHDTRPVASRPDNSALRAAQVDVTIATVGGSHVGIYPTVVGEFDTAAWVAAQTGSWYGEPHRAWSGFLEAGHRWSGVRGRPWVRVGVMHASGDAAARDGRHGTFFPVLPSSRTHARSTAYAAMNLRDWYVQVLFEPHRRVHTRLEGHQLGLVSGQDRWYVGSGATQRHGTFFGYTARASFGETQLGHVVEGSADLRVTSRWSLTAYLGWMRGGGVVRAQFAGDRLVFGYVESVLRVF